MTGRLAGRTEMRDLQKHPSRPSNVVEFGRGRPANYRCCLVSDPHLVQW